MSDDLILIFHKSSCSSGFISHPYHHELKHLYSDSRVPRGIMYRISPKSYLELPTGKEPSTTLSQDYKSNLDILLKTILQSKPHFVLCIKPSRTQRPQFDKDFVLAQYRALHIGQSSNPMKRGLSHRLRLKMEVFYAQYRVVAGGSTGAGTSTVARREGMVKHVNRELSMAGMEADIEDGDVVLSEGTYQLLERKRIQVREKSALRIQRWWRRVTRLVCQMQVVLQTLAINGLDKVTLYRKYNNNYLAFSGPSSTPSS